MPMTLIMRPVWPCDVRCEKKRSVWQLVQLSTTDASGNPVSVNWKLSPDIGQINPGFGQGLTRQLRLEIERCRDRHTAAVDRTGRGMAEALVLYSAETAVSSRC